VSRPAKPTDTAGDLMVRTARLDDAETIAAFNVAMARETEDRDLDPDRVRRGVRRLMERPDLGLYLVAQTADRVVAALMVTYEWSDWRDGCFWWIQSLYVRPDYRRRGLLRRLYAELVRRARDDGDACGLRLYVEHNNAVAQQAYAALGLTRTAYAVYETEF